ncbi:Uncharacterised protein [Neisseria meningitidis]|nr:Uncharacterised protein [Neisseria meningitidis]
MAHAVFDVVETGQPAVEVDTGITQGFDTVFGNPAFPDAPEEFFGIQPLHTAIVMGDDHNLSDLQFKHGNQKAPHHRTPRVRNQRAGIFNQLGIAVFQTQRVGQQPDNPRIHTGQNRQPAFGVFVGKVFFIFARFDKLPVVGKDVIQLAHFAVL